MSDIIKFSKKVKCIKLEDGKKIDLPQFCSIRINSYTYSPETRTVEITCKECKNSFPVLKLELENGEQVWKDIHNEEEYHFITEKSGHAAICNSCKQNEASKKGIPGGSLSDKKPYTVLLTKENKQYLQLVKVLKGKPINELINEIVDAERNRHPVSFGGN